LAGFLHCAVETRWQRFGQFLNDLSRDLSRELMLDDRLRGFMLDFRKIASEIQHKFAIFVGNPGQKLRPKSNIKSLTTMLKFPKIGLSRLNPRKNSKIRVEPALPKKHSKKSI